MTTTACIMIAIAASLCLVSSMRIGDNQSSMEIGDNQSSMGNGDNQSSMEIGDNQSSMEIGDTQSSKEIGDTQVGVGSENVFFMKMLEEYANAKNIRSENVFFMKMLEEYNNHEDIRSEYVFFMKMLEEYNNHEDIRSETMLFIKMLEEYFNAEDIGSETMLFIKMLEEYFNAEDIGLLRKRCQCTGYSCSCCFKLPIVKKKVCVQVTFIPSNLTLDITLTLNGKVILHTKISAKNPPPICAKIPILKKVADVCLLLYDIQIHDKRLHFCMAIEVKILKKVVKKLKLGCFNIPPGQKHSVTGEWSYLRVINDAGIF